MTDAMDAPTERRPLFSEFAEQQLLGALLLDGELGAGAFDRIHGTLTAADFYLPEHVHVFAALCFLLEANKPCDVLSTAKRLQEMGKLEAVGGVDYVQDLRDCSMSVANVVGYAQIVRDNALLRKLGRTSMMFQEWLADPKGRDATTLLDQAQAAVLSLNDSAQRAETEYLSMSEVLSETMDYMDEATKAHESGKSLAVSTGLKSLDEHLGGGFYPGELIVIGAGPSQGKSAFAMGIADHVGVALKRGVGVNVMEMPAVQIGMRALAGASHVNAQRMREGRLYAADWDRLNAGLARLSGAPIYIDATPELTIDEIRARVRRLSRRCDLGLVIVDYLQLVKVDERANRVTEIGKVSRGLKGLAMQLKVPVIALSSLNRERFKRTNKRPTMGDLRESGDIEADADVIMFIHREEMYDENPVASPYRGQAEIIFAKQRSGNLGTVMLGFRGDLTRFVDLT